MPLEEPDNATAGTGAQDLAGEPTPGQRVALLLSAAVLTILLAAVVWVVVPRGDRSEPDRAAVARSDTHRRASEVEAANSQSNTTTSAGAAHAPRPTPPVDSPPTGTPTQDSPTPVASAASIGSAGWTASLPGTPVVSVSAAGSNGCTASWTVDDGGSPIVAFFVTRESLPAPPGPDGTDIGTALQLERTTATTATVDPGWTVQVAAKNALGTGPASEPILCR